MQSVCGYLCASEQSIKDRKKKEKKELREFRIKTKTRTAYLKEAQAAFNAWRRWEDKDLPCISCGRYHQGQNHAGHYMATSIRPQLRFHPDNVHLQCQPCNSQLSGNLVLYRIELLKRIGEDRVNWLEGIHEPVKWDIEQLKSIKKEYTLKLRLAKENEPEY